MMEQTMVFRDINALIEQHPDIAQVRDKRTDLTSFMLLLTGVGFLVLGKLVIQSGFMQMLCIIVGVLMSLLALVGLVQGRRVLVYLPTKTPLFRFAREYPAGEEARILNIVRDGRIGKTAMPRESKGGKIRVEYLYSENLDFLAISVSRYQDMLYIPQLHVRIFRGDEAQEMADWLGI